MSNWPHADVMAALTRSAEKQGVTAEMVTAARRVLDEYFDASFGTALVRDYVHGSMSPAERDAGIVAMNAEDARLNAATKAVIAGALAAALEVMAGASQA